MVAWEFANGQVVPMPPHAIIRHLSILVGFRSILVDIIAGPIRRRLLIGRNQVVNHREAP